MRYVILALVMCLVWPAASSAQNVSSYPATVEVMQKVYAGEINAHRNYAIFSAQAVDEGYPSVAHLFSALKVSESIHARNFKEILEELDAPPEHIQPNEQDAARTKKNLKAALKVELSEIDQSYPTFIAQITPEGYVRAVQDLTYAWEAEKQHKALIKQMLSAVGLFLNKIERKLEKEAETYYVCQRCGSTLMDLPESVCPICHGPKSAYIEIQEGE